MGENRSFRVLAVLCAIAPLVTGRLWKRANTTDVLEYVNPLIGSQAGGNVFAGATLPYGMAKGKYEYLLNEI